MMTDMPIYAQPIEGELRVGHVFSRAWDILAANFFKLGVVAVVPSLLQLGLSYFVSVSILTVPQSARGIAPVVSVVGIALLVFVAHFVVQAVILHVAFQYLRGQRAPLSEAIWRGLGRFFPLLGLTILLFLAFGAITLVLTLPAAIGLGWMSLILWVVFLPALWIVWSMASPCCVVERIGPIRSLQRSVVLTKGHRWKIFGILLLLFVSALIGALIWGGAAYFLIRNAINSPIERIAMQGVSLVIAAIVTAYFNSLWIMTYHDLRVAKEGIDTEQIAAVFD